MPWWFELSHIHSIGGSVRKCPTRWNQHVWRALPRLPDCRCTTLSTHLLELPLPLEDPIVSRYAGRAWATYIERNVAKSDGFLRVESIWRLTIASPRLSRVVQQNSGTGRLTRQSDCGCRALSARFATIFADTFSLPHPSQSLDWPGIKHIKCRLPHSSRTRCRSDLQTNL
jgi:hypothetical protein